MSEAPEFKPFEKIARLSRDIIITEKIDGTNGVIHITEAGVLRAGSRRQWLLPEKSSDNFGFARWAFDHEQELLTLGPGYHYGEWWGQGIQRGYGLTEKRFSLFNVRRWGEERPACCGVVPVLYTGDFQELVIDDCLYDLKTWGSKASPGFMDPEGVVIYHTASKTLYKKTIYGDEQPKGSTEL